MIWGMKMTIKGLKIKAFNSKGIEIKIFEIVKVGKLYYGMIDMSSTNREFLELKVGDEE